MKRLLIILSILFFTTDSFASGIASNSASAPCTNNTLETYSGNSNLSADWQPNTINLRWYNEDEKLTVQQSAQSCTYDGTLTVPQTPPTRTGYTFAGWEVKYTIPAEYTELQYIETTGTQYIDLKTTTLLGTNPFTVSTTVATTSNDRFGAFFGNKPSPSDSHGFAEYFNHTTRSLLYARNTERGLTNSSFYNGLFHKVIATYDGNGKGSYYIDGTVYNYTSLPTETVDNELKYYLFATNGENNTPVNLFIGKSKITTIIVNGIVIFNLIPVRRNSDNELGVWDSVSKAFLTNSGSGTFTAGPAVQ